LQSRKTFSPTKKQRPGGRTLPMAASAIKNLITVQSQDIDFEMAS
jgi:hypothetical protein